MLLPHLAVLCEGGVVVLFELLPQSPPLLLSGKDASLASGGSARREVLSIPPFPKPSFERRKGDGEGLDDVLPRGSSFDRIDRPDPEFLRVDAHDRHLYTGPLYSQGALEE